jgi:DNA-binding FrmR family transcriptional regulator
LIFFEFSTGRGIIMKKPVCHTCDIRHKHRSEKEYTDLIHRLNRIEGQVRGVRSMLEDERYCIEILTQVSAIQSALNSFNKKLLTQHIHTCVAEDIRAGKEDTIDELCTTLQKLMK